ncbi:MAG: M20/M25/M40 family metallo-hydrolase, partial [Tumebacillaceae bacterium]
YGAWQGSAFDAKALTQLFRNEPDNLPADARHDLETGHWLFGRGTMDMKCGLALQMAMIEEAANGAFDGNLLLLAVCDEEVNSVGMRAAVPIVLELAEQHGLDYQVVLNSEPMFTRYPGDTSKYIYTGTIGKVNVAFLCYGKETHVGEPFSGLNANFMVSCLNTELELNPDLCELVEGEVTPPPTNLIQKDLKKEYSVQIPHRAATVFNVFMLEKPMDALIRDLRQAAERAAEKIRHGFATRIAEHARLEPSANGKVDVKVISFDELREYALRTYGAAEVERIESAVLTARAGQDERETSIALVDELAILCKELAPMIVLFFAPPYYPPVNSRQHPMIQRVVTDVIRYGQERHGVRYEKQNFFSGICDLSYVGLQYPVASLQPFTANMPLWEKGYSLPLRELEAFDVPVLNIGPVGKDAHKWTERLDIDFAFHTLRDILPHAIHEILRK